LDEARGGAAETEKWPCHQFLEAKRKALFLGKCKPSTVWGDRTIGPWSVMGEKQERRSLNPKKGGKNLTGRAKGDETRREVVDGKNDQTSATPREGDRL